MPQTSPTELNFSLLLSAFFIVLPPFQFQTIQLFIFLSSFKNTHKISDLFLFTFVFQVPKTVLSLKKPSNLLNKLMSCRKFLSNIYLKISSLLFLYIYVSQKRVNIVDLLSLESPVYKISCWLASGNLNFRRAPTIPRTEMSGISHMLLQLIGGGIKYILYDSTGKILFESCTSSLWASPHELRSFADFVLYPLSVINHSHKYNYMLSSMSYPSESVKPEMVLGNCKTHAHTCTYIYTYVNKYPYIFNFGIYMWHKFGITDQSLFALSPCFLFIVPSIIHTGNFPQVARDS